MAAVFTKLSTLFGLGVHVCPHLFRRNMLDVQSIICSQNLCDSTHTDTILNTSNIKINVNLGIADAGATSHILLPQAPIMNIHPTIKPLKINLPDGVTLQSTHTAHLAILWLPDAAREAHIISSLNHTSLVLIKSLFNAGETCNVTYNEAIWQGYREPTTGLWVSPLRPEAPKLLSQSHIKPKLTEAVYNIHALTSKESLVKFLQQCLFSPPKQTLLKALESNQFPTWPGFMAAAVRKHLRESSPATDKGHMKRQ